MKLRLLCISSIAYLLVLSQSLAQDTTSVVFDTGFEIYVDYGKIATLYTDFESKAEAGLALQMANRIAINVQFGYGSLKPNAAFKNGTYESIGYYGRFGFNYLLPLDNVNLLFAGVKYGVSFYDEAGNYEISSDIFPTHIIDYSRDDLKADWFEVVIGSEKKLRAGNWYLGGQFTIRILNQKDKFSPIDTYAIPGYGRTFDKTVPAINVHLKYKF